LRENRGLKVSENGMLWKIYGPKKQEENYVEKVV